MDGYQPVDAPTVGSLCTGIGGWDLGFEMAGWQVAWQCEANPYRTELLRQRFGVTLAVDAMDPAWVARPVDCLVAGLPQSNYHEGGPLYEAVWQRIAQAHPTWVVLEVTHPYGANAALRRAQQIGYDGASVVASHTFDAGGGVVVNWLRVLLVLASAGACEVARTLGYFGGGCLLHTGNAEPLAENEYGAADKVDPTALLARTIGGAYGFPYGWLTEGPPGDMVQAVVDATPVPVAIDVARLLARPAWKV